MCQMAGGNGRNVWIFRKSVAYYLTLLLVNHENAFSMASEIRGAIEGSINQLALHDFAIFKELYDFDLTVCDKVFRYFLLQHSL